MQRHYRTDQIIRFRRWSRKGYAMFYSLGRCVTIGCLNKEVTEVALKKQKSGMVEPVQIRYNRETEEEDDVSAGLPDFIHVFTTLLLPQATVEISYSAEKQINSEITKYADGIRIEQVNSLSVCHPFFL